MQLLFRTLKSMRWFLSAVAIVLFITINLSYLSTNSSGQNVLHQFVMSHLYFWLLVRACIILGFVIAWPYLVTYWAKKYAWDDDITAGIIRRRWRYAVWLIIIDLTFQLL